LLQQGARRVTMKDMLELMGDLVSFYRYYFTGGNRNGAQAPSGGKN